MFDRKNIVYVSKWELVDMILNILKQLLQDDVYESFIKILYQKLKRLREQRNNFIL